MATVLEIFFLPFLSQGHMIPTVAMARLFASHGVKVTLITTPFNALPFQTAINQDIRSNHPISLHILKFPSAEVGLPEGIENFTSITSPEMGFKLYQALSILQQPIKQLFHDRKPDGIVSDMFYPWTVDAAAELGIPRLLFNPSCFFATCAVHSIESYTPHETVQSDDETFVLPNLPHHIQMTRSQLPDYLRDPTLPFAKLIKQIRESEKRSYGLLLNSFYELEMPYVEYFRKETGRKVWHVGPVSLKHGSIDAQSSNNNNSCLSWLDSKKPNSVLYVCFGSMTHFTNAQLFEIASGLEASGHQFIWVVRKSEEKSEEENWLPNGFEQRMIDGEKGMIIRGWAPQGSILDHPAIGGFVTHGGWNSLLESVTAGVPVIVWPLYSDQFYNEKLITEVLEIGVSMGVETSNSLSEEGKEVVKREKIEKAIGKLMDGGDCMRTRVRELGEIAKQAVEEGGSSYASLIALIEELQQLKTEKKKCENNETVKPGICS